MRQFYGSTTDSCTEANPIDTLQKQFAGYGSTQQTVARFMDKLAIKQPLEEWTDETVEAVVNAFIDEKFPTVFALNKIDHPDADKVRGCATETRGVVLTDILERQQNCQDARPTKHCAMLRYI